MAGGAKMEGNQMEIGPSDSEAEQNLVGLCRQTKVLLEPQSGSVEIDCL